MQWDRLKWDGAGLVTVVVQDDLSGEIRMLAHANQEALVATLKTGMAHFYSRSRKQLWLKGETSGNTIRVRKVWLDCDKDALVYIADPAGPSCHTGRRTCFFGQLESDGSTTEQAGDFAEPFIGQLWSALSERASADAERSYTKHLLDKGPGKIGAKLREEADELAQALEAETDDRVANEAADVIYHMLVGLLHRGLNPNQVMAVLRDRFGVSGHQEKASRAR